MQTKHFNHNTKIALNVNLDYGFGGNIYGIKLIVNE